MRSSSLRTLGGIGAVLTCPCHIVPLMLLAGGTAGGAWLAQHVPGLTILLGGVFLVSLWLLLRSEQRAPGEVGPACPTCSPDGANEAEWAADADPHGPGCRTGYTKA